MSNDDVREEKLIVSSSCKGGEMDKNGFLPGYFFLASAFKNILYITHTGNTSLVHLFT